MAASDDLLDQAAGLRANKSPNLIEQSQPSASDALLDGLATERKRRTDAVLDVVTRTHPDKAAEANRLSKQFNVDVGTVEKSQDEFARLARIKETQELLQASPFLARQMQDPAFAAVAQDDVKTLGDMERTLTGTLGDVGVVALKGAMGLPQAFVGLANLPTFGYAGKGLAAIGLDFNRSQQIAESMFSPAQQAANKRVRQADGFFDTLGAAVSNPSVIATTVGESLPQMLGGAAIARGLLGVGAKTLGAGMVGPVRPGLIGRTLGAASAPLVAGAAGEGIVGSGSAAEQIRGTEADGLMSPGQVAAAIASGAGTGALSLLGGKVAQKLGIADIDTALASGQLTQATVQKGLVRQLAEAGISEGVFEEMPQSAQEQIWQNIATDRPVWEGVANAAAMGMLAGAVTGGGFQGVQYIAGRRAEAAGSAEQRAQLIEELNRLASASSTVSRDAEAVEQYIAGVAENGPVQNLYIDANTLMQSGMAEQLAAVSPSVREQIAEAVATGGEVRIPIAEYTARIAGTEFAQSLVDDLRIEGEQFTRRQAQEYMQSGAAQELEQMVQTVLGEKQADQEFKASQDRVKTRVLDELNNLNRFTAQKNEVDAVLIAARSAVRAAQLGMTPEQFFEKQVLKFAAEGVAGEGVLAQGVTAVELDSLFTEGDHLAEAGKFYKENLQGSAVDNPDIGKVRFSSEGIGKLLSDNRDSALRASVVKVLPQLIANAKLTDLALDRKGRSGVEGFRYLLAPMRHDGKLYAVRLAVKMSQDGKGEGKFYTLEGFKADTLAALVGRTLPDPGSGEATVSNPDVSLEFLETEVNEFNRLFQSAVPSAPTFQQNESAARGSFNPATNTITLLKGADLSTFLHEAGHYFFEGDIAIAADLAQQARIMGIDSLTEGERQILADVSALMSWHGIQGDIDAQLGQWYAMDFEERRTYHERTAESFEAYLFEGKAPSIELQPYFQKFRAWLISVYRSLKDFLARNPEAGKLDDTVRGVFDRMLATTEQIQLAEQGRSMMPLFATAEQAGMTVEEFANYQAVGIEATADAIQDLQARTLRDLSWTRNARSREIKRLQKEAKARRDEVQMEVRREVMSQPVYRAWQFLTNKLTADDKLPKMERPKSSPNSVDESQDSLFVAIAKLGGINRDAAAKEWGLDQKDNPGMPVFGKPVVRKTGGLSIDGMAELLSQYGYLPLDENGKWDLRDLESAFMDELGGAPQYSSAVDPTIFDNQRPGDQVRNLEALGAGRLDMAGLNDLGIPDEIVAHVKNLKMTAKDGLHPDIVADMFGFTSGDELVRTLAAAQKPKDEIEGRTDQVMLERYGELATPEAIEREADKAIHNEARGRFIATEANALEKATGQRKTLAPLAKQYARALIARLKIRDIRPSQYAQAEVRAAKASGAASQSGDLATAAAEKRNQLVQHYATRAAYDAQDEIEKGVRYLRKFEGDIKGLDADYADQIAQLLERFNLRKDSLKAIDKRTALAAWIEAQREAGFEPDIPEDLKNEAFRKSFKDMTVEEFRGLVDTVKQIEHLGRLKNKLLTAKEQREFEAVKQEIVTSIEANAGNRTADTRTPTTNLGRMAQQLKRFWASHIKAATWARVLDGGKDGGPMWEYFIRSANERGDMETRMRAEATAKLTTILAPLFKLGKMGGAGQFFPTIGRSLNREARIALALNIGNTGNLQRLLGGEGWTEAQILPVLQSLTPQELAAVQAVWDHFESYRPEIGAKERRVYGKEPQWVDPGTGLTAALGLRGGYYPIKYDPAASQRAEEHADAEGAKRQLQGAYTTATTRRSFTKSRAEEVSGRPLLYTLAGLYSGVNDVIHDLAWHEWLIDANRLLRSNSIDTAIRNHYGPEAKAQFKTWVADVAEGDKAAQNAGEIALGRLRQGISAAGLGFNVISAAMQITGFNQSIVRVGAGWIGRGIAKTIGSPIDTAREVVGKSSFMAERARTQFRELNELRNRVQGETGFMRNVRLGTYFLMMRMQKMVDLPTWVGAYEKAIAGGNNEERAIALADQAVIDSQGSGMTKDLSAIERGSPALKLFTVYYSYMNTAFNMGVAQGMTAKSKAKLAVDLLMLYTVPAVLGKALKDALTPGGDDDDDLESIARKLAAEQLSYLMGTMMVVREFSEVAKIITGAEGVGRDYGGPAGLRAIGDTFKFAKQASQGEFDDAFRKSAINLLGDLTGLPAAQINRMITGTQAFADGETDNPAAILFGYQKK